MESMKERLMYAVAAKHDFLASKDGKFVSGEWKEAEYAELCGWKIIGSVADLVRKELR